VTALLSTLLAALAWLLRTAAKLIAVLPLVLRSVGLAFQYLAGRLRFRVRPDDIFVATYPRSGTTLTQMILYQLTGDGEMSFAHISDVFPWLERALAIRRQDLERLPSPRMFKTHFSYRMVPKGPGRYIYVTRDGRDVAVSYFHMQRSYARFRGSFAVFFRRFMRGHVPWGSWFRHVARWKANRRGLDVLYLRYEDLVDDPERTIRKIAGFCRIPIDESQMPRILERCGFEFMKRHEARFDYHTERLLDRGLRTGAFIREGRSGSGKAALTAEQQTRFEAQSAKWLGPATPAVDP